MNYKSISLIFLFAFLVGCVGPPVAPPEPTDVAREIEREIVLEESKKRRPGKVCEDEDSDHECYDQCDDIYDTNSDEKKCEELTVDQIEILVSVDEIIEEADDDDLEDLNLEDLKVYLKVSVDPFEDHIKKYSQSDVENFFYWMVTEEERSTLVENEDDEFKILKKLLSKLDADNVDAFNETIEDGNSLFEVAVEANNEHAMEWFQDYLFEEESVCDTEEVSDGCFTLFCKIGDKMDDDYRSDWLKFEDLENYLDDIIEEGINGKSTADDKDIYYWGTTEKEDNTYEDTGDLGDDWVDQLCKKGTQDLTS